MRRAVDTNVLVYAHVAACPEHSDAKGYLEAFLAEAESVLVVVPIVLHEFVHVITDPRRFDEPVGMPEALALARIYLNRSNVECLEIAASSMERAFSLLDQHRLGRKRIADTLLVATLIEHGVAELITCNGADFRIFEEIRCSSPLASGA